MTDETIIPLGDFIPTCSHCGTQLGIEMAGEEPDGDDNLICTVHGHVGLLKDFRAKVVDESLDDIKSQLHEVLKNSGFKLG